MRFDIEFSGHENIRSNHKKTIEITKESNLTLRGDCIVGVDANFSCNDLPAELKKKLQDPNSKVTILIRAGDFESIILGQGHPDLSLSHKKDIVVRKSSFISPRTLAINCDKGSDFLPREMITILQDPKTVGTFTIIV